MPKASSAKAAEVNFTAPANTGKAYTGEKIMKPLDSGGGSGIMKSTKYDFLPGVIGTDKISKQSSKQLDEIVSVIPKKHLDVIGKTVKKVEIVPNRGYCSYDLDSRTLILDPNKMNGSIVHEFGHVLADAYNVYDDTKFLNILFEKFDSLDWGNTLYTFSPEINDYVYLLKSDKLLDIYQGRIYVDFTDIDYSQPIPLKCFQEYYSVGFDMYFKNPELLQEKDEKLYNYFKEMLSNGWIICNS